MFDPNTRENTAFIRAGFEPKDIGFTPNGNVAFVGCRRSATGLDGLLINAVTDRRLAAVRLGFCPAAIAFAADNSAIYASGGDEPPVGPNTARLAIFSAPFNASSTPLEPTSFVPLTKQPRGIALSPTAAVAYVATFGAANATDELVVVNLSTRTVQERIDLGVDAEPVAFQFNRAGTQLFVANRRSNEVVVVDTTTNRIVGRVPFASPHSLYSGDGPTALLLSENERSLLVARSFRVVGDGNGTVEYEPPTGGLPSPFSSEELHCFSLQPNTDPAPIDTNGGTLSIIDTTSLSLGAEFTVGRSPAGLVIADQARSYFTASQCEPQLSRFATADMTQINSTVGDRTAAIGTSPDGSRVYLAHPDTLSIVDAATGAIQNVPARGRGVSSLAYLPATSSLYAARPALGRIDVINVNDVQNPAVASVPAGSRPGKLVADAAGTVYGLNFGYPRAPGSTITRIAGNVALPPLAVADGPTDMVIDGDEAFVASFGDLVPVVTSVQDIRRGFGDRLLRITQISTTPQISALTDRFAQLDVQGPLTLSLIAYQGNRRVVYPNFGSFGGVVLYDPDSDFGRTIFTGERAVAARTALVGAAPNQTAMAYVLATDSETNASVIVIDIAEAEANLGDCDLSSAPRCIVVPLAMPASDIVVGPGADPVVLVTSFDTDSIALFRASAALPSVGATPQPTLLPVGAGPRAAWISTDGATAYVANELDGTVTVVDLSTFTVAATITVLATPTAFAETPAGRLFVGHRQSARISVIENRAVLATITLPD